MQISYEKLLKYWKRLPQEGLRRFALSAYMRAEWVRTIIHNFHGPKYPKKWIFIVGCYNSGTTLLLKLLRAHSNISFLLDEGVRFTSVFSGPEDYGWSAMWVECLDKIAFDPKIEPDKAMKLVLDWSPWFDSNCDVFLEKSISNVPRMEWLDKNLENTYFVGIMRNPYAVSEGIRRHWKPKLPVSLLFENYPIELAAKQWLIANSILKDQGSRVKRFYLLKYETLLNHPVTALKNIFRFINEPIPTITFVDGLLLVNQFSVVIKNSNRLKIKRLSVDDIRHINSVISAKSETFGYRLKEVDPHFVNGE